MERGESNATGASQGRGPAETAAGPADEALVIRAAAGETQAFDALVLRYQDRVFHLLVRLCGSEDEAQDLAQETFVKAFRALSSFRRGSRFFTWLFRIAMNTAYSRGRQVARRQRFEGLSLDGPAGAPGARGDDGAPLSDRLAGAAESPLDRLERASVQARVREGLARLSEEYRAVVLLRDLEGMDYEAIAEALDLSRAAVKSRLHRARLELARLLRDLRPADAPVRRENPVGPTRRR